MRHLFYRGFFKPSGVSGESLRKLLMVINPEIYGSMSIAGLDKEPEVVRDEQTPLAGGPVWALLNLMCTVFCIITSVIMLLMMFFRKQKQKKEQEEEAQQNEELKDCPSAKAARRYSFTFSVFWPNSSMGESSREKQISSSAFWFSHTRSPL